MPIDFIRIDPAATPSAGFYGNKLVSLTQQLRATIDLLDQLKALMDHLNSGVNFAQIEATFGVPAGQGQTVYDLLNGTSMALRGTGQNSNALALIDRVG
jgi:hypothetical protein